ncbi:MAG: cheY5 [Bacillota bacterium]|nr:cheY5 [Bacillota bacterium]
MARILIVDDSIVSRKKLKIILEEGGHQVAGEAGEGLEAIQKYKTLSPDLVTMDVTMPDMDGVSTLKLIIEYNPSAKVIMITSLGKNTTMLEALSAGASDFITKPFSDRQVRDVISGVLEHSV